MSDDVTVHHGDALDVLSSLAPLSVDVVLTSPPYAEQRKATYGGVPERCYPRWTAEWMELLRPALKPTASVLIVISPHVRNGELSDYVLRTRLELRGRGWIECDEIVWVKPDSMPNGRNERPVRAWESVLWYSPGRSPWANATRNGNPVPESTKQRMERNGLMGRAERHGWTHYGRSGRHTAEFSRCKNWLACAIRRITDDVEHPAPFPLALAQWLLRLVTPPGGTVLDPFAGSGTTGEACIIEGFRAVLIEREADYLPLIEARLSKPIQPTLGGTA